MRLFLIIFFIMLLINGCKLEKAKAPQNTQSQNPPLKTPHVPNKPNTSTPNKAKPDTSSIIDKNNSSSYSNHQTPSPTPPKPKSNKKIISTGEEFNTTIAFNKEGKLILKDAPKGMGIYPNGLLVWSPTKDQVGDYNVSIEIRQNNQLLESKNILIKVKYKDFDYDGIFVDLSGEEKGDGSPNNPFGTFSKACENLNGFHKIYIRGGTYYNPGFHKDYSKNGRYPAITKCIGDENNPIEIIPWGNEKVKIKTDALYGLKIKDDSKYITIKNLEIEGEAKNIDLQTALQYWWWDNNDTMQSSGISANGSYITIKNCIVHDMPGSGISVSGGAYATIEGNIVYNSDWWTIAGSKGIGITQAIDDKNNPANGETKNKIVGNLIFNIEQRLFSHVWAKGFATLTIDEGEAFLIQEGKRQNGSNSTSYSGRYLIKDNLIVYNGKTGVINLAKNVDLINNSYYNNGGATKQSGFRVNSGKDIYIAKNAIESDLADTIIYSISKNSKVTLEQNYAKGIITQKDNNIDGIIKVDKLFKNPQNLDFSLDEAIPSHIGISKETLANMKQKLNLYKINVQREHLEVNKSKMAQYIINHAPGKIDCSHINDNKPYILIYDINRSHPIKSPDFDHSTTI